MIRQILLLALGTLVTSGSVTLFAAPDDNVFLVGTRFTGDGLVGEVDANRIGNRASARRTDSLEPDLDLPPSSAELGSLCLADGDTLGAAITADDALWLARMIDAETFGYPSPEDAQAMLWALAQRRSLPQYRGWSLGRLAQAYSRPISREWLAGGGRCGAIGDEIGDACSSQRIARRERNRRLSWNELTEVARRAVADFAAGRLANEHAGAVGWMAPATWRQGERDGSHAARRRVFHSEISGNVYFALDGAPDTRAWQGAEVRVASAGASCAR